MIQNIDKAANNLLMKMILILIQFNNKSLDESKILQFDQLIGLTFNYLNRHFARICFLKNC
jgi:hypothetical protein